MPATYEPIASQTLGSAANSLSFTSIPSTFTDLILVGNWAANGVASWEVRINSDTGTNYSITRLIGNGSSASSQRTPNDTLFNTNLYGTTNGQTVGMAQFMSYANTSVNKTVLFAGGAADQLVNRSVGLWRSTAAISSVTISIFSSVNYAAGSTFSLFGIKAA
jgi:hypothetical protein